MQVSRLVQKYGDEYKKLKKQNKKNKAEPPLHIKLKSQVELYNARGEMPPVFTLAIEPKIIVRDFDY